MKSKLILLFGLLVCLLLPTLARADADNHLHSRDSVQKTVEKLMPEKEHEHDEQTEMFHQEYFSEPWRMDASLGMLDNSIIILAALILLLWLASRLITFYRESKGKKIAFVVFKPGLWLAVLLAAGICMNLYLTGLRERDLPVDAADLSPRKMMLALLGETRFTLAALLWIKVDNYHHEYQMRGEYFKNPPLLQLTRFITYLDPHFAQAYSVGGYDLAMTFKEKDRGIDFIKEGLHNNPQDYDLNFLLGFVYFHYQDYLQALPPMSKAYLLAKNDVDKTNCARILSHIYQKLGDKKHLWKYVNIILHYYPDDYWCKEQLKNLR